MSAHIALPTPRHRRPRAVHARLAGALNVVATLGSLVTLSALLVLAGALGGLVDGVPAGSSPTVTVTFKGAGH